MESDGKFRLTKKRGQIICLSAIQLGIYLKLEGKKQE